VLSCWLTYFVVRFVSVCCCFADDVVALRCFVPCCALPCCAGVGCVVRQSVRKCGMLRAAVVCDVFVLRCEV